MAFKFCPLLIANKRLTALKKHIFFLDISIKK